MNTLLKIHKELTKDDFNNLWEKGLFVFDTNILLDLYRLPQNAKDDLLNILTDEKLNKRVWLPFQGLLEFLNNRITVIGEQKNTFIKIENLLQTAKKDIEKAFNEMKSSVEKMQLSKRHSLINPEEYFNPDLIKEPIEKLNYYVKELKKLEKKQSDVNEKDALKDKILSVFEDKIGDSLTSEELEAIYKEGDERYKNQIPPGYLDIDKEKDSKPDYYLFEDKKYIRKFGDLVIWQEIIKKAKSNSLEFIVFVTNDLKEDWIQIKDGKKIGVRIELLNELYFKANSIKLFHIYDTSSFVKYAKEYLKIDIKEESIKDIKALNTIYNLNLVNYRDKLYDQLKSEQKTFNEFTKSLEEKKARRFGKSLEVTSNYLKANLSVVEYEIYSVFRNPDELLTFDEIFERLGYTYIFNTVEPVAKTLENLNERGFIQKIRLVDSQSSEIVIKYKKNQI